MTIWKTLGGFPISVDLYTENVLSFTLTLKASARISAPFWLVRLERPTKNSLPAKDTNNKVITPKQIYRAETSEGWMQNVGYNVLNWCKNLKFCLVGVCPINTRRTNKKSICDYWAKADSSLKAGEAAEARMGSRCTVAAQPLQNEPPAILPTGNVSNPSMWNPFQLEETGAQNQCLETQLSVPCFFLAACTQ